MIFNNKITTVPSPPPTITLKLNYSYSYYYLRFLNPEIL
jgi:hypothetical protein